MDIASLRDGRKIVAAANNAAEPTALLVCPFGGGFGFGAERAGLKVVGALEHEDVKIGAKSLRQRWPLVHGSTSEWNNVVKGQYFDVVLGSPPVLPFAGSGMKPTDFIPPNRYMKMIHDVATAVDAKAFAIDVPSRDLAKRAELILFIMARELARGRSCAMVSVCSSSLGAGQVRRHSVFVSSQFKLNVERVFAESQRVPLTTAQALAPLDKARAEALAASGSTQHLGLLMNDTNDYDGYFTSWFPHVPPGTHIRDISDERKRLSGWTGGNLPGFVHQRARMDRPTPPIYGAHTLIHPTEHRYFTSRELATIVGFPIDYGLSPGPEGGYEVGRTTDVAVAEFIVKVINDSLEHEDDPNPTAMEEFNFKSDYCSKIRLKGEELQRWMEENDLP